MRKGYLALGVLLIFGSIVVALIGTLPKHTGYMAIGSAPAFAPSMTGASEAKHLYSDRSAGIGAPTMKATEPQPQLLWSYELPKYSNDIAISADGKYVAVSASDSKTVYLLSDGGMLWDFESDAYLNAVAVYRDGTFISIGGKTPDGKGEVYLLEDGNMLWKAELDTEVLHISLAKDFVGVATKEKVYLFTVQGKRLWIREAKAKALTFAGDLLSVLVEDSVVFFNGTGNLISSHRQAVNPTDMDTARDGGFVIASGQYVYRRNLSGEELWSYQRPTMKNVVIDEVSITTDGKYVLGVSRLADESYLLDKRGGRIWRYNTGKYAALSDSGVYAAVASWKTVHFLDSSAYVVPADSDRDGIPDYLDTCPETPETKNSYQDDDGCPDALPRTVVAVNSEPAGAKVYIAKRYVGKTPLVSGMTSGVHSVLVKKTGYDDWSDEVDAGLEEWSEVTAILKPQFATLSLKSDIPGSRVFIDGNYIGDAPITAKVLAAPHKINVKRKGYEEWSDMVGFSDGEVKVLSADLVPRPGTLSVSSNPPGAMIYVDDVYKGATRGKTQVKDLPPGTHRVKLVRRGYKEWSSSVTIGPGEDEMMDVILKRSIYGIFTSLISSLLGVLSGLSPLLMFLLGAFFMKKGIFEREIRQTFIEVEETVGDVTRKKRIPVFVSKKLPTKCPKCASPFRGQAGNACEYCGSIIEEERHFRKVE